MTRPAHGPDIVVTGLGAVSAAGIGTEENWRGVRSGRSAVATDPELAGLPVDISCRVPEYDVDGLIGWQEARRIDRTTQLAIVAAHEALADAGLDPKTWDGARVGVVMGTSNGGAGTMEREYVTFVKEGHEWVSPLVGVTAPMNMLAGYLAIHLGAFGPNLVTATACASGPTALGTARMLLRSGACDVVVAGGAEAPLTQMSMSALHQMGALSKRTDDPAAACRPFDAGRDGMVAAEGAGVLILERAEDARARGARRRARLAGYGASADGYHLSAPDPSGAGAERAIRMALADADLAPGDIDHVNAHGSSTPLNDLTEGRVIGRVYGDRVAVTSTKGVVGHALGAAGALESVYTVLALEHGEVPPTANLEQQDKEIEVDVVAGAARPVPIRAASTHSFGFGGQNAVIVFDSAV
ncbi:beta-ketoacyl-[acyl-carrier-protein] synthase family protein [Allostreptomyces psammosilenae]|uniref:3-oxoacyl-[acyl-carrier-protein] synthase II n=1 Tax=Allostreptomyces psammosilenae TaxID=1892865 RepID=A0A852ZR78_9ACTN|nr:beta-ketoacyl-[acyl-carrier-protein] synthase family protein [Allostreptomyces psammosilenae]NYI04903.1 3-oxoacyl-[acyl-carrier-protein] synthase II [Allostreptomyces psammosilenae]